MVKNNRLLLTGLVLGLVVVAGFVMFRGWTSGEPEVSSGPATFRRLSEAQYMRSIEDIFGAGIKIPGRFDPPLREEGLLAIGDGKVVVSSSGFEQYELRAREIAAQVLAEDRRAKVMTCTPQSAAAFDQACASQFVAKYGRLLYRRPLDQEEMNSVLSVDERRDREDRELLQGPRVRSGAAAGLAKFHLPGGTDGARS